MVIPAEEQAIHQRWKLKPEFQSLRGFDKLLENDFLPPEVWHARQAASLRKMIHFAATHCPYYMNLFARLGLGPTDIDSPADLTKLPVLTKHDVIQHGQELRAWTLPPGEVLFGTSKSSGTTGRRVSVVHTNNSNSMFSYLAHRNARWFKLNPMGTRVLIQPPHYITQHLDRAKNPDGTVVRREGWFYLSQYFETGPEYAFNISNPMEQQVAWLKELRPQYAVTDPGIFEEWLLANNGTKPVDSLEALIGIGSQLTPSLRAVLEERYGIPVEQAYGLNEIGIVAVRCEAGRYHVHAEHCLVEITDENGSPSKAGEVGHVLVTGLLNAAMPLIRYDTGDLAEAAAGACPCGRTLPSFGEITGRYRRYAGLPKGTRQRFQAIRQVIDRYPLDELVFLRRFQVHQDRSNRFTLRLKTAGPVPDNFRDKILAAWKPVDGMPMASLEIAVVDDIPTSAGGKILDFVSDFYTDSAIAAPPLDRPVHETP